MTLTDGQSMIVRNDEERDLASMAEKVTGLRARQDMRRLRLDQLTVMVGAAKMRVARQPKSQEFLERLQERCHQKSVGLYEELLSAVVQDVLPGEKNVALTLKTVRGLPSLDIEMVKAGGERESILEGSGGAVTNILSAGLRVIALARSGAYPFLVFDEPDCWLKPALVPQFANVIGKIALDLQIQVLIISHHDTDAFSQFSSQVRLERRGGKLETHPVGSFDATAWEGASSGIKELRLQDYMSHASTVVPLCPGVTCLTGENDIGKSAIVAALRALFYGSGSDSAIAHGKTLFKVEAEFHNGTVLSLERYLKKSPKQRWRYYVPGQMEPMQDSSPKDGAPEWIDHVAKIAKADELDIAFTNQKSPVFLLNESPSRRASILAVGRESAHLQRLIGKNKERNLIDAKIMRDGESEGALIKRELSSLEVLDTAVDQLLSLKRLWSEIKATAAAIASLRERIVRATLLAQTELDAAALSAWPERLAPLMEPVDALRLARTNLAALNQVARQNAPADGLAAPEVIDIDRLSRGLAALTRARVVAEFSDIVDGPLVPQVNETDVLRETCKRLMVVREHSGHVPPQAVVEPPALLDIERLSEQCKRLLRVKQLAAVGLLVEMKVPIPESLKDLDRLSATLLVLRANEAIIAREPSLMANLAFKRSKLADAKKALYGEMGGVCPTCSSMLDNHSHAIAGEANHA